jgi:peroxiredoxin
MAPDFSLPDLDGQEHRLSDYYGQVVLLNFWTTWCPPCREEMPALQAVYDEYQERGFTVLGVNLYQLDNRGEIENFVGELGISFPILLDTESIVSQQLYRVIGIPTNVFIDRTGMIAEIIVGAIPIDTLEPLVHGLVKR